MTKTRVLALLSVIALLAALPLSVALAQQPPGIPSLIQGMAMLDGAAPPEGTMVVATVETETEGEDGEMMMEMMDIGMADVMADGSFTLIVPDSGGKMVMFSLSMMMDGETMKYEAMSDPGEVMTVGGMDVMVDLEASTGMVPPTRTPVQVTDSMRGPRGPQGASAGEAGAAGEAAPAGSAGARGAVGPAGSAGADGADGARRRRRCSRPRRFCRFCRRRRRRRHRFRRCSRPRRFCRPRRRRRRHRPCRPRRLCRC